MLPVKPRSCSIPATRSSMAFRDVPYKRRYHRGGRNRGCGLRAGLGPRGPSGNDHRCRDDRWGRHRGQHGPRDGNGRQPGTTRFDKLFAAALAGTGCRVTGRLRVRSLRYALGGGRWGRIHGGQGKRTHASRSRHCLRTTRRPATCRCRAAIAPRAGRRPGRAGRSGRLSALCGPLADRAGPGSGSGSFGWTARLLPWAAIT